MPRSLLPFRSAQLSRPRDLIAGCDIDGATVASAGAASVCSIFIASRTASGWPFFTLSPAHQHLHDLCPASARDAIRSRAEASAASNGS
jgi:hypothetical protein